MYHNSKIEFHIRRQRIRQPASYNISQCPCPANFNGLHNSRLLQEHNNVQASIMVSNVAVKNTTYYIVHAICDPIDIWLQQNAHALEAVEFLLLHQRAVHAI